MSDSVRTKDMVEASRPSVLNKPVYCAISLAAMLP